MDDAMPHITSDASPPAQTIQMATDNMSTADVIARIIDLFRRRTFSKRGVVNIASLNDALRQASGDEALAYDGAGDGRDAPDLVVQVKTRGLEEYPPPVPISTGTRVLSMDETRVLSMDEIRGAIAKSAASFQEFVSSTELCACVVNAFHELSDQDIWDIQLIGMGDNSTRRTMQLLQPLSAVQYIIGHILPTTSDADRFDRMLKGRMDNFGCILEQSCYKIRDGDGVLYAELICLLAVLAGKTEYGPKYAELQRHAFVVTVTQGMQVRTVSASLQSDDRRHILEIEVSHIMDFSAQSSDNQLFKEEAKAKSIDLLAKLLAAAQTGAYPTSSGNTAADGTELHTTMVVGSRMDCGEADEPVTASGGEGQHAENSAEGGSPTTSPRAAAVSHQVGKERVVSDGSNSTVSTTKSGSTDSGGGLDADTGTGTGTASTTPTPSPVKGNSDTGAGGETT